MGAFAISEYTLQKKYTIKPFDGSAGTDCIHFLNVGNSDAILLESAGKFALIDCGEDTDNPRGLPGLELEGYEDYVVDYLNAFCRDGNGMIQLEFILGTHAHSDHLGGFDTVLSQDNVKVKKAYIKPYFEDRLAPQIGKVDVLKLGHHGYKDSSTKRYIDTLQPELAIQTTGNPPNLSVKWNVSIRNRIPIYSCVRHDGIILDLSDVSHVQLYDRVTL